jgi:hypothetical protein
MDENVQQKIKTSTQEVEIVHRRIKVVGGMVIVSMQTWMACTWKENISRLAMGSTGITGKAITTPWKGQQWWFEENRILTASINK